MLDINHLNGNAESIRSNNDDKVESHFDIDKKMRVH